MKTRTLTSVLAVVATLSFFACDDKSSSGGSMPAPSASATTAMTAATPSAAPTVSSSPIAMASDSASAAPMMSASAAPSATAVAAKDAGGGSSAPTCGAKDNPCPLQAWMQKNANPAVSSGDAAQVGTVLEQIAKYAPPGYTNWAKIANDGAAAGKGGDLAAAKASCRSCHDQYKQKYKTEMRDRKI